MFIFNEDGTILITNNGKVINAFWKFIPQNSSILITAGEETLMFRPAFFNKDIFALQQDGVERYLFMIDEEKKSSFQNISLDALAAYVLKESTSTSNEIIENRQQLKIEKRQEDEEKKPLNELEKQMELQQAKEQERQTILRYFKEHKDEISRKLAIRKGVMLISIIVSIMLAIVLFLVFYEDNGTRLGVVVILLAMAIIFVGLYSSFSSPFAVIGAKIGKEIRFHDEKEIRKLYAQL